MPTNAKRAACPPSAWLIILGVSLTLYVMWIFFTTLGTAIGPALGNVEALGFGMAFPGGVFGAAAQHVEKAFCRTPLAGQPFGGRAGVFFTEGAGMCPPARWPACSVAYFWSAEA